MENEIDELRSEIEALRAEIQTMREELRQSIYLEIRHHERISH